MRDEILGPPADLPRVPPLAYLTRISPRHQELLDFKPTLCPLDGLVLMVHARCRRCRVLCGPAHTAKMIGTNGLCPACYREALSKQRRLARKAAELAGQTGLTHR